MLFRVRYVYWVEAFRVEMICIEGLETLQSESQIP